MLGGDWYDVYFGQSGIFADRSKLLDFLRSQNTTGMLELTIISQLMQTANVAAAGGFSFQGIDAIGARLTGSAGAAVFGGVTADAILNLTAGEFSVFAGGSGGFIIGESVSAGAGLLLFANMPSNQGYRGSFGAVGIVGGDVVGLMVEGFWSAPLSDRFNAFDKAHGAFFGVTGSLPGLGGYGEMGYSLEALRVDQSGTAFLPDPPTLRQAIREFGSAVYHDVILHPVWPWSPFQAQ
jgi:hypothetical protein